MSVGKRSSTADPLTEHDVAERLTKAVERAYRILVEVREMELRDPVEHSRYHHRELLAALADELVTHWDVEPRPLKESSPYA